MNANPPRTYSLASCYENALTIVLRLASLQHQPAANSQDFRTSIRAALKAAMEQAKSLGYSSEANQLAVFAAVALLDESVLKMQNPAFADWAQRPLQEEMFGHNRAGEVFFQHLGTLLARPDSQETADCLEVYCLCMLLGFKGQYAIDPDGYGRSRGAGDVQNITRQAREKIDRIRGKMSFLPDAPPPSEVRKVPPVDRWSRGLGGAVLILLVLALLAYGGFWFQLHTGALQIS